MKHENLEQLDANDPLAPAQREFEIPDNCIYLNGNSLGPLSTAVKQRIENVLIQQWGEDLITAWNKHAWIDLPVAVGEKIAKLIGAAEQQTICCDSVSINLFKVLGYGLNLRKTSSKPLKKILTLQNNFPTDLYVADGLAALLKSEDISINSVPPPELQSAIAKEPALILLTQVDFRNGAALDIASITEQAHANDSLVIWDLSHSVGVMPLSMDEWQVDFAVGCGYKYLNGGPGAPGFIYVASRHQSRSNQPLQGWMGHKAPFQFSKNYEAGTGVVQFLSGTPPILSMAALDAALDLFANIKPAELRRKSLKLTEVFLSLREMQPPLQELRLESPADPDARGAQLSFSHPQAYEICQAMQAAGVFADFRRPDVLRLGFSPLFLRYRDMATACSSMARIIEDKSYKNQKFSLRKKVT